MTDRTIKQRATVARSAVRSRLLKLGGYDPTTTSPLGTHLRRLLSALEINVVIDVGARRGEWGTWLRRLGYRGRICSFEPVSESFAALERLATSDGNWTVRQLALGREAGSAEINVAEVSAFSSFLEPNSFAASTFGSSAQVTATETVRIETLDAVFGELVAGIATPRAYLKLDTQGWDLEVLAGATESLGRVLALQTEVSVHPLYDGMPTMQESLAHLASIGFEVSTFTPVSFDEKLRAVELDCVAVHTDIVPAGARERAGGGPSAPASAGDPSR